jgi:hypothetical protein
MVSTVIGRGSFVLEVGGTPRLLWYLVQTNGIKFYDQTNAQQRSLFELLPDLTSGQDFTNISEKGDLSLISLPASPKDAFYAVRLSASANAVRLHVTESEKFASRSSTFLKNLDITFIEGRDGGNLQVEGKVNLCLLGRSDIDIELGAALTPDGLVFKPLEAQPKTFEIAPLGHLTLNTVEVGRSDRLWDSLQALYSFSDPTGNVFRDSSGMQTAVNLKVNGSVTRIPGGISIGDGVASSRHSTLVESEREASELAKACKSSNAVTIAAWLKPIRTLTRSSKELPARIVSLSETRDDRNITLGQHVDTAGKNRYIVRLRRKGSSNDGRGELFSKAELLPTDSLQYVVFTRGNTSSNQFGKIYVNGNDQTAVTSENLDSRDFIFSTDLSGDFSQWSEKYPLVLGNEKTGDRPWDGELYQVAIYSRALSKDEIFHSYCPAIRLEATLTLSHVPVPLNRPLPVTIDLDQDQLTVEQESLLEGIPFLQFNQIRLDWKSNASTITGKAKVTLWEWDQPLDFNVNLTADELKLSRSDESQKTLNLKDVAPLPPLGTIVLKQLTMTADRKATSPAWQFQTDGQVTFATIPPPLKGPFPVQIFLFDDRLDDGIDNEKLWLSVSPTVPLKLVENLSFDRTNLRFVRNDSGWQVQPDLRGDRRGISIPIVGQPRPLTAEFIRTSTTRTLALAWSRSESEPTSNPSSDRFGKLDLSHFSLKSNLVPENVFWDVSMSGQIPLRLSTRDAQAGILEFSTEDGKILANQPNTPQPTRLDGKSQLQSLGFPIFKGDLQLKDAIFSLNGIFTLFPNWSLLQVNGGTPSKALIQINSDGHVQSDTPVQVTLPDFVLLNPRLTLANGRLVLNGGWLGQDVSFNALHRANQSVWEGTVEFKMPFSLTLGPLYDPQSSAKLADQIQICQTQDCRQIMTATLVIELSSAGFLARVRSKFPWQDEAETTPPPTLELAEFQLFEPPSTRNALLGHIIQQVRVQADKLFAPRFKPVYGYFITVIGDEKVIGDQKPLVYLGKRSSHVNQLPVLETKLPAVFTTNETVTVTAGAFKLVQTGENCTLTITAAGRSQPDLKLNYLEFLKALEKAPLIAGAANLIKARIAERVPVTVDQLLFYHYGVDAGQNYVDLQAGMRLRVDYQTYQFIQPSKDQSSKDKTVYSGFIGSGTTYYQLNSYPYPATTDGVTPLLGFDSFLNLMQPLVKTNVAKVGAGGVIDLLSPGYRMPYFRLVYPSQFAEEEQKGAEQFATLIGATDLTKLQAATAELQGDGTLTPSDDCISVYFRGRAAVIPEISVFVQGQPVFVPVGTTLRHVLERYSSVPAALPKQSLSLLTGNPYISRLIHDEVKSKPSYHVVNLEATPTTNSSTDIYDLPLVKGDRIVL